MAAAETRLAALFADTWWLLLLRGLLAIAFGVLTWIQPGLSLVALVLVFGAYSLADGVLGVWAAFKGRKQDDHWWVLLIWGLASIVVGVLTLMVPGITTLVLLFYIAAWAMVTGAMQIVAAIRLRKEITGEWWLVLGGVLSVVFGVLLLAQPGAGALALLWLIATYAVLFGALMVFLAFKMRGAVKAVAA